MSYKCKICRGVVPAGKPRLLHLIKRKDGSIAKELLVCELCQAFLAKGTTVDSLMSKRSQESDVDAAPVAQMKQPSNKPKIIKTGE